MIFEACIYIYIAGTSKATAKKPFSLGRWEPYLSLAGVITSTFGFGLVISHCNDDINGVGYLDPMGDRLSSTGPKHLYVL